MAANSKKPKFLMYKGKPLVRSGNFLYYGDMADEFVIMLQILTHRKINDLKIADRVTIQLLDTNPAVPLAEKVVKKSEKKGLYSAMDIATVWLHRALENN